MMGAPRFQPYLDVAPTPFRWRLGVRPLDLADWFQSDEHTDRQRVAKARIMHEHAATAFVVMDDVHDEAAEVLAAVVDWSGGSAVDQSLHSLDAAARLVPDDLVLLVERDGGLVCGGGSVCFPNRWDLRSKVGLAMREIHAPVAGLNEQLADPIDGFLQRLMPARSFWRLGWGVLDTDELYQAVDGTAPPRPIEASPSSHHLRVERETLRRFPDTRCILFTIRTHVTALGDMPANDDALTLAAAIEGLPTDVAEYKQLDRNGPMIARWLRQLATTSAQ